MIKMFVMHTCPDCEYVERQVTLYSKDVGLEPRPENVGGAACRIDGKGC